MTSSPYNEDSEVTKPTSKDESKMFGLVLYLMEQSEMENTIFDCANSKKLYNIHYASNDNYLK